MSGTLTISIEVELGWGFHDMGMFHHLSEGCRQERVFLDKLLDACDELDVPITFDVVGHLLLERCDGHDADRYPAGWFDADPETSVGTNPEFYAPDMVENIASRPTDHEIATHTFSHVLCGEMAPDLVDHELRRSQALHESVVDGSTVSLVPPRHSEPPSDVLAGNDIEIVRQSVETGGRTPFHRHAQLLAGRPPLHEPRLVDGVVKTYGTSYPSLTSPALPRGQWSPHWSFRWQPTRVRQRLHVRRLAAAAREAAATDSCLHLWCHLYNLSNEYQWPAVKRFLEIAARYRDEGSLSIRDMAGLNRHVREE